MTMIELLDSEILRRVGDYFMGKTNVHRAVAAIAQTLIDMGIPFAIAGALAANAHGYERMTTDVDLLLTSEGLAEFKAKWLGRGWVERFPGSRGLRDTHHNVKIDVIVTGDYPGDGEPKPVSFPHPSDVAVVKDGIPYISLPTLLELKIASGMTAKHRLKDLADVMEIIRVKDLALDYAERLDPYVRGKYQELWEPAQVRDEEY